MDNKILIEQSQHWEKSFSSKPEMFGSEPSHSAKIALENFKKNNVKHIIELGAGLGRDTIFFAKNSIKVTALDYSPTAVEIIKNKSNSLGLNDLIEVQTHDLRQKLNFTDNSFDGCYSHMLYCMAFTYSELENLNTDVCRVLNKDSLNIYTVRNHSDADYKKGTHRGEDLYEMNGYIVHYFSDEKIKNLLKGFKNLSIDHFDEGSFPRKLSLVINQKI